MENKLQELKTRLLEYSDLSFVGAVLGWDQSTYMPPAGAEARARQSSLVGKLAFERLVDPAVGHLLDDLRPYEESLPYDHDDAALIRNARRSYERYVKVPVNLVGELLEHTALTYSKWAEARPANDWARMEPLLEKTLDLSRRYAECFPGYDHIADPLIDMADYGMKAQDVRRVFAELREGLVPLVKAITSQTPTDDSFIDSHYPQAAQLAFGEKIIKQYGYDFQRGRQDLTHHPFMTKFAWGDVRITTRVREDDVRDALFSTLHEAGHALYEMGINPAYEGTSLDGGTSAGVHESQSRLWENIVGRSREFWDHYYPDLQAAFPDQLRGVTVDQFHRAINKVTPSLIRVDADEVTYNLHVMIRFDIELALLEGSLAIKDLPEMWNSRYASDLGVTAPDHRDGVLQDVHWYGGLIGGAFQGYTLGNLLSAQFYAKALEAHPEIPSEIGQGKFDTLHTWLKENIYQHGSKFTAPELVQRVTGGSLQVQPLLNYLRTKYGALYNL
ncbi:MAG: carboxypeptidase M32 [Chloroflexi bacterium]|uniref:carboxypeptidase M32 n=1 Tax=Candidatus Flexifilum breve TaxID=3140694 RepID=UPI003135E832|nr:carboxypeptidase M32 [Chloroflexota bacterium]